MDPFNPEQIQTKYVLFIDCDAEHKPTKLSIKYFDQIPSDDQRKKVHEQLKLFLGIDVVNNALAIRGDLEYFELNGEPIELVNGWNNPNNDSTISLNAWVIIWLKQTII